MDRFQRPAGSRFISEIELADEAAAAAGRAASAAAAAAAPIANSRVLLTAGAESVASSTGPDLRAHAVTSSADTSLNEPILYKKVIYVPGSAVGISPFRHGAATGTDERGPTTCGSCCCSSWFISGPGGAPESKQPQTTTDTTTAAASNSNNLGRELRDSLLAYAGEWAAGCRARTLYVAHLLVWACLVPALVFGTWLARKTGGEMGTAEVLMSSFICGAMLVVFGKQPALLVGVTAPSLLFVAAVASTADRLSIQFLPWFAWVGVWCSACLMLLAALNASRAASHLSSFSWEVLQVLVGVTLLWDGIELLVDLFNSNNARADSGLLSLWLATCTTVLAISLSGATAWNYFNRRILEVLEIAGPALALLLFSVLPLLPLLSRPELAKVNMPNLPDHTNRVSRFGAIVSLRALPMWTVFLAFIPGSLLAGLIFFDHLSTSLLVQDAIGRKVHNHRARSWDIFVIAASVLLCSFFGLPFSYGLFAQSITHAQALTAADAADSVDMEIQEKPTSRAHCQRLSALVVAISAAIFLLPAFVYLIRQVPQGVIAGLFLQMAVLCLKDLTLTDRIKAVFVDSSKDPTRAEACHLTVRVYSIVQASCAVTVFAVTKTAAAALYPLFLLVTIWLRHDLLHHFFSKRELMLIDQKLFSAGRTLDSCADGEHPRPFAAGHLPKSLTQSGPHSLRKLLRDRMGLSGGVSGPAAAAAAAAACQAQQAGSESARSLGSPTVLTMATRRRLKERSKRRYKRKISTGQSSLETTSSSNLNMPLQSRHRLTSSSLKKQKSGHYPTVNGSTRGGSIHKRQHAMHRSRQQQGRGFESKGSRGQSAKKATVISPFGEIYHPSSQVHASTPGRSLCLESSCGGHVVSKFKKQPGPASAAAAAAAAHLQLVESPSNNSISGLRRSLPSPFGQSSPKLESQKLHANSLFDPDWKDSSPPSQSMQVHENLAYLGGDGSSVIRPSASAAIQLLPKREDSIIKGPPSSPSRNGAAALTLRFAAPVPPNQPLLHDLQRAWEVSSSSWSRDEPAIQAARVSSFRLCSDAGEDACCYTSGSGNGNHGVAVRHTPGREVASWHGNSEGSDQSTEPWNEEMPHQQQHPETSSNGNTALRRKGHDRNQFADVDDTRRDVIHGWEAVSYPPSEMRASRYRLASEVFFAEKGGAPSRVDSSERESMAASQRRMPSSPWEDMSPSSAAGHHHKDSPEISSFHFSASADPWASPNPRTKRKSGSGSELQASRAAWERPVSSAPALRPLQRTPERSWRNTRQRSSSSELTDPFEERAIAKASKQPTPVWR